MCSTDAVQRNAPQLTDILRTRLRPLSAQPLASFTCAECPTPPYDECSRETWTLCQWRCLVGDERRQPLDGSVTITDLVHDVGPYAGGFAPAPSCDGQPPPGLSLEADHCEHWYRDCRFDCAYCADEPFRGETRYRGDVAYYVIGAAGTKPPLLYLTGDRSTKDTMDPLFVQRLARDFQVVLIDTPGIGHSTVERVDTDGRPHPFRLLTFEAQAKMVHDFLQRLMAAGEIDQPPIVVGNAGGARVAGYLVSQPDALAYPAFVVVSGHITGASGGGSPREVAAACGQAYDCCNLRNVNYTSPCDDEGQQSKRRFLLRAARIALLGTWPDECARLAQTYGVMVMDGVKRPIPRLVDTTMPVLIVQGAGDYIQSPCQALCLREQLRERDAARPVELLMVDGGHTPQFGASVEAVAAGIARFAAGEPVESSEHGWDWLAQFCDGPPCALDAHTVGGGPHCRSDGSELLDCKPVMPQVGTLPRCGTCASDVNLDGTVGLIDLAQLLPLWNAPFTRCQPLPYADLDADDDVDRHDLARLLGDWGACPAPSTSVTP